MQDLNALWVGITTLRNNIKKQQKPLKKQHKPISTTQIPGLPWGVVICSLKTSRRLFLHLGNAFALTKLRDRLGETLLLVIFTKINLKKLTALYSRL